MMTIIPPIEFTRPEYAVNPTTKSVKIFPNSEKSLQSGRQTELLSARSNCLAQCG